MKSMVVTTDNGLFCRLATVGTNDECGVGGVAGIEAGTEMVAWHSLSNFSVHDSRKVDATKLELSPFIAPHLPVTKMTALAQYMVVMVAAYREIASWLLVDGEDNTPTPPDMTITKDELKAHSVTLQNMFRGGRHTALTMKDQKLMTHDPELVRNLCITEIAMNLVENMEETLPASFHCWIDIGESDTPDGFSAIWTKATLLYQTLVIAGDILFKSTIQTSLDDETEVHVEDEGSQLKIHQKSLNTLTDSFTNNAIKLSWVHTPLHAIEAGQAASSAPDIFVTLCEDLMVFANANMMNIAKVRSSLEKVPIVLPSKLQVLKYLYSTPGRSQELFAAFVVHKLPVLLPMMLPKMITKRVPLSGLYSKMDEPMISMHIKHTDICTMLQSLEVVVLPKLPEFLLDNNQVHDATAVEEPMSELEEDVERFETAFLDVEDLPLEERLTAFTDVGKLLRKAMIGDEDATKSLKEMVDTCPVQLYVSTATGAMCAFNGVSAPEAVVDIPALEAFEDMITPEAFENMLSAVFVTWVLASEEVRSKIRAAANVGA